MRLMTRAMHIFPVLLEPEIALKLVSKIEDGIYSCPERQHGLFVGKGYRQLLVENYTVIYRVDDEAKDIIIVTVRYSPSQF